MKARQTADRLSQAEWAIKIEQALARHGLHSSKELVERWAGYLERLMRWNELRRLVGDRMPEKIINRHLIESIWLSRRLEISGKRLIDLGSGGGFPGLALAIGYNPVNTTLVELSQHKAAYLRQEIDAQGLEAEVIEKDARRLRGLSGDLVTVRALEKIEDLPRWAGRYLQPQATLAAWVNRELYEQWAREYGDWRWMEFLPLPEAERRGIGLAQLKNCST